MQYDIHERFDLSDVEVSSPEPVRRVNDDRDMLDSELDALVAELQTAYRRAA